MDKYEIFKNAFKVSDFSQRLKEHIDKLNGSSLYIKGEVTSISKTDKHLYFDLRDTDAVLGCAVFSYKFKSDFVMPSEGESVVVEGNISYYTTSKASRVTFIVTGIYPIGEGELRRQFEELKCRLEKEGYFAEEHKKSIPQFARNVLILTSKSNAVIQDFVNNIRRRNKIIDIFVKDIRVQGADVVPQLIPILESVDKLGYDVIVIARGGGSLGDLAPFYDENLVKAVYKMNTPVISAIGHESDHSLLDFVADKRASTPTEAAILVAYDVEEIKRNIMDTIHGMYRTVVRLINGLMTDWQLKSNSIVVDYRERINVLIRKYLKYIADIDSGLNNRYQEVEKEYMKLYPIIDASNPEKILDKGYFTISSNKGQILDINEVDVDEEIKISGKGGRIITRVLKKEEVK